MTRLVAPAVALAIVVVVVLLGLQLGARIDDQPTVRVATTSETTSTTVWPETQPTLPAGFDPRKLQAPHRAKRSKPKAPRVMRGVWPWDAVKECETPGLGWDAHTGNGFEGGLQFHPRTWSAYMLPGYPPRAFMASREQQINVAERVLRAQGWAHGWPSCSLQLGLR